MPRAGTPAPGTLTDTAAAGQPSPVGEGSSPGQPSPQSQSSPRRDIRKASPQREDPIAEAAARAKERLRRQREVAVAGLEAVAAEAEEELPLEVPNGTGSEEGDYFAVAPPVPEPAPGLSELPAAPTRPEPFEGTPAPARKGEIAELRDEVDALRRDMKEAVAEMTRDIERAERLAADRARKEARRQGRKSERAARRAARAAMDTPDDPT